MSEADRHALLERGLLHRAAVLDPADVDGALAFMAAHDFEEAWRHSPAGDRLETSARRAVEAIVPVRDVYAMRYEKLGGYDDDAAGANLRDWHRVAWPRLVTLEEDTSAFVVSVILFLGAVRTRADGPLLVLPESHRGEASQHEPPHDETAAVTLWGERGDAWIVAARALQRRDDGAPRTPRLWRAAVRKARLPGRLAHLPARFSTARMVGLMMVTGVPTPLTQIR